MSLNGAAAGAPLIESAADLLKVVEEFRGHTHEITLVPRLWNSYAGKKVVTWSSHLLSKSERPQIPDKPGIYTFLVQPGVATHPANSCLVYVGKAASLRDRSGDYLTRERRIAGRPKLVLLLNQYPKHIWFCYALYPKEKLTEAEEEFQRTFLPPANDQFPADVRKQVKAFR